MNIKNIIICTSVSVALAFAGSIALAPAIATDGQHTPNPASVTDPTEEPYTAPVLHCEAWQVPGWLNGHGDPTSCVNNEAVPGSHKGEPPATPEPDPTVEAPAPVPDEPEAETPAEPEPDPEPVCK